LRTASGKIAVAGYSAICRSAAQHLQSIWTGEARLFRTEIAKHVAKITLTLEGRVDIASGTWNLPGGAAVRMVPGARIELATPAFSGRRSTKAGVASSILAPGTIL